ncbi:hypothetical protein BA896_022165 [Janthinobacterium lividum]|uniref:Uncharacterized protein n=1 Tax=Janthinobacterium lividum TaxID=29581 RepID=A0A1E8PMZ4_9BURK|nr:hypothetical protein BA896_022165 [Janthinobacterium lividum]
MNAIVQGLTQLKTFSGAATEAAQALPGIERYRASVAQALDMASMDPNTGVAAMQNAATHYQQVRGQLRQVMLNLDRHTADALLETKTQASAPLGCRSAAWRSALPCWP